MINKLVSYIFKRKVKLAVDICGLYRYREFSDGITFFHIECSTDFYKGDHRPNFCFQLIFLNCMLFTVEIYNVYHEESQ